MSAATLLRLAVVAPFLLAACTTKRTDSGPDAVGPVPGTAVRPQVQLTWRLFEAQRWIERGGEDRESAIFELLIEGGTPSRVELGRRASLGCTVRDTTDGVPHLAELQCYSSAHGEYATVDRPSRGELRIEAFGQDEAPSGPGAPRTHLQTAIVRIAADAEIVVDRELGRIPADAPQRAPGPPALHFGTNPL